MSDVSAYDIKLNFFAVKQLLIFLVYQRYQLWGGCFEEEPSAVLRRLNDSLPVDSRLYREDIRGSKAWAAELHLIGHLSTKDNEAIQRGLDEVGYI